MRDALSPKAFRTSKRCPYGDGEHKPALKGEKGALINSLRKKNLFENNQLHFDLT
jgi:hypothetical protein